jgi:hypothetical protein
MFYYATSFNQNLNEWDVSELVSASAMFSHLMTDQEEDVYNVCWYFGCPPTAPPPTPPPPTPPPPTPPPPTLPSPTPPPPSPPETGMYYCCNPCDLYVNQASQAPGDFVCQEYKPQDGGIICYPANQDVDTAINACQEYGGDTRDVQGCAIRETYDGLASSSTIGDGSSVDGGCDGGDPASWCEDKKGEKKCKKIVKKGKCSKKKKQKKCLMSCNACGQYESD